MDSALGFLLLAPYRCLDCRKRFFRPTLPGEHGPANVAPPPAASGKVDPFFTAPAAPEAPTSTSILILDSDPAIRRLLRRLLERCGYLVTELSEAANLGARLGSRHVDLLVADFALPAQETLEFATRLVESYPGLKIMLLSSDPMEAVKPLVSATLRKPFHNDALVDQVRKALGGTGSSEISVD